jgi:hypothetical protein
MPAKSDARNALFRLSLCRQLTHSLLLLLLLLLHLHLRSYDVDPAKRIETPDFYGYIPDGKSRSLIFVCMVLNGALLLVNRSFCAAVLALVRKRYFVVYSACDMGLYLFLKVLRKDFAYWVPVDGFVGFSIAVIMRVVFKVVTDYTGILQFRAPADLGGMYWSADMILSNIVPFAAVAFYFANTEPDAVVFAEKIAWRIVGSLSGAWFLFFLLFFKLMNKKYRKTFFSIDTGNDWAVSFFLNGDTDARRVKPLRLNKIKWNKIRPEMKEFVLENWERWEKEQPKFFTDAFKKRVPDDMLPKVELRRQTVVGGGQRRRSSLGELMGVGASATSSATVTPTVGGAGEDRVISSDKETRNRTANVDG